MALRRMLPLLAGLIACARADDSLKSEDGNFEQTGGPDVRAQASTCADALERIPVAAWHPEGRVDPAADDAVGRATRVCLSSYIRLRTVNPPSAPEDVGETAAADFFKLIFDRLGIPSRTSPLAGEPDPKRLSLVATLAGKTRDRSVLLLNHSDVVPATGAWKHPPFSGDDDGTFVWGRGALDMKSLAIMQLVAVSLLKRARVPLEHDVHFVAAADEEVGGRGAEFVAVSRIKDDGSAERIDPLDLRPGIVLNEGGTGLRDALLPGRDVFVIGSEEKGVVWTQFAHPDPRKLLRSIARLGLLKQPKTDGLAPAADRDALRSRCRLAGLISDESQKTNVQPRLSKITLDCEAGSEATVRRAIANLAKGFDKAPVSTITTSDGGNGRQRIEIAIEMGSGGHGSSSVGATALDVAASVLVSTGQLDGAAATFRADDGVEDRLFKLGLSPANQTLFQTLARSQGETAASVTTWLTSKPGLSGTLLGLADGALPTDAPFRNTCSWTTFKFPADGGEARAKLDCRLGFDAKADPFEKSLAAVVGAEGVLPRTDRAACFDCYRQEFNHSPTSTPEYRVLASAVEKSSPAALSSPYLFPGSSDTFFFRKAGVATYGFMPAAVAEAELRTFHAVDERIPVVVLAPGSRIMTEVVHRLANRIPASAADDAHRQAIDCRPREGSSGRFRWGAPEPRVTCNDDLYLCTRTRGAARFVSGVAEENDAKVSLLGRLPATYDPNGTDPTETPAVEAALFTPRNGSARVFTGQGFEIDTGDGAARSFLLRCDTPLHQEIATLFTRAKVRFYKD